MSTPTSIRNEIACAVRAVTARRDQLPVDLQPEIRWGSLRDLILKAERQTNRAAARKVVERWRDHHLETLEELGQ